MYFLKKILSGREGKRGYVADEHSGYGGERSGKEKTGTKEGPEERGQSEAIEAEDGAATATRGADAGTPFSKRTTIGSISHLQNNKPHRLQESALPEAAEASSSHNELDSLEDAELAAMEDGTWQSVREQEQREIASSYLQDRSDSNNNNNNNGSSKRPPNVAPSSAFLMTAMPSGLDNQPPLDGAKGHMEENSLLLFSAAVPVTAAVSRERSEQREVSVGRTRRTGGHSVIDPENVRGGGAHRSLPPKSTLAHCLPEARETDPSAASRYSGDRSATSARGGGGAGHRVLSQAEAEKLFQQSRDRAQATAAANAMHLQSFARPFQFGPSASGKERRRREDGSTSFSTAPMHPPMGRAQADRRLAANPSHRSSDHSKGQSSGVPLSLFPSPPTVVPMDSPQGTNRGSSHDVFAKDPESRQGGAPVRGRTQQFFGLCSTWRDAYLAQPPSSQRPQQRTQDDLLSAAAAASINPASLWYPNATTPPAFQEPFDSGAVAAAFSTSRHHGNGSTSALINDGRSNSNSHHNHHNNSSGSWLLPASFQPPAFVPTGLGDQFHAHQGDSPPAPFSASLQQQQQQYDLFPQTNPPCNAKVPVFSPNTGIYVAGSGGGGGGSRGAGRSHAGTVPASKTKQKNEPPQSHKGRGNHDNTPQEQKYLQTNPFSMYNHNKTLLSGKPPPAATAAAATAPVTATVSSGDREANR
ncbi:uncharacterized protein LOC126767243 [Bactrocera neohumeralis]|uniref:uncharacterized protein LOC126767243 n=1 Tax=Bactrocera neohumeralis TaxID=98809 RepID=UPI00216534A7|nr:uncharacterized protein LOC126767243 [Bactrocera neohumeralis]